MKKIAHISALAACFVASTAQAADGTINFTGTITDQACTVDVNSATQTVSMGTISNTAFGTSAGVTAGAKTFDIVLQSCPESVTSASVRFDGTTHAENSAILALSSGQTASHVGIALYEKDSATLIPVGTSSASVTLDSESSNTLSYIAKYMSTSTSVGAGSANSSTAFTITYQ